MEQSNLLQTFGIVLGFFMIVFWFLRKFNEIWSLIKLGRKVYKTLPPGDMGWPFIGLSLSYQKEFSAGGDPDSFINHILSRNRRVGMYKSHLLGKPSIIVKDPEICRRIYLDDERFKSSYPRPVEILLGNGLFSTMDHKYWYRLIATPIKGNEALCCYVDYIEELVVKGLEEWSSMKEPIELLNEMRNYTFNVISHIFMGSNTLTNSQMEEFRRLYDMFSLGLVSNFPFPIPGSTFHQALKARKEIEKKLQSIIEKKRRALEKNEEREKCQIEEFIEAKNGNGEKLLNNNSIIEMMLEILFGGHHTSAHAAMWALIHISENPHVLEMAKEEQEAIIKQRPSTQKGLNFKEIKQMKYLAKVINETLRRTTIALANFREAKTEINIGGYTIPKGWSVQISIRSVHMDPQIYPNPREFNPSRWDNYTPKAGAFIPFGMGNRFCAGSELAKLEITILLHHFLLNYKLERVNPKCHITYLPFPRPVDNCLCKISRLPSN